MSLPPARVVPLQKVQAKDYTRKACESSTASGTQQQAPRTLRGVQQDAIERFPPACKLHVRCELANSGLANSPTARTLQGCLVYGTNPSSADTLATSRLLDEFTVVIWASHCVTICIIVLTQAVHLPKAAKNHLA